MSRKGYFARGRRFGVPGSGRKPDPNSKAGQKRAAKLAQMTLEERFDKFGVINLTADEYNTLKERQRKAEGVAFEKFKKAKDGCFSGFTFVELFHEKVDKYNAIYTCEADDTADAKTPFGTFHTNADGVDCYFFSKKPTKRVDFNRSVYFFDDKSFKKPATPKKPTKKK